MKRDNGRDVRNTRRFALLGEQKKKRKEKKARRNVRVNTATISERLIISRSADQPEGLSAFAVYSLNCAHRALFLS